MPVRLYDANPAAYYPTDRGYRLWSFKIYDDLLDERLAAVAEGQEITSREITRAACPELYEFFYYWGTDSGERVRDLQKTRGVVGAQRKLANCMKARGWVSRTRSERQRVFFAPRGKSTEKAWSRRLFD